MQFWCLITAITLTVCFQWSFIDRPVRMSPQVVNFCHFAYKFFLFGLSLPKMVLMPKLKVCSLCSSLKRAGWQYSRMPHPEWTTVCSRKWSFVTVSSAFPLEVFLVKLSTMFFLVTVNAEVFPIRSIRRIVQMISVLMVDRQQVSVRVVKFPCAFGADEAVNLKRPLTIITLRKARFLQVFHGFINGLAGTLFSGFWISSVLDFFHHDDPSPSVQEKLIYFFTHSVIIYHTQKSGCKLITESFSERYVQCSLFFSFLTRAEMKEWSILINRSLVGFFQSRRDKRKG